MERMNRLKKMENYKQERWRELADEMKDLLFD